MGLFIGRYCLWMHAHTAGLEVQKISMGRLYAVAVSGRDRSLIYELNEIIFS